MKHEDVRKLVRREIERAGGTRALAREWDVSPALLSKLARGECGPGPKIFRHLGIVKAPTEFVKAPTAAR